MNQCYIAYLHNAGIDDDHVVVKIGFSKNPGYRFRELCSMSWIGPKWIDATSRNTKTAGSEIEKFMHDFLYRHRVHHEWFHVPRAELDAAKKAVWKRFGETFSLHDVSDDPELEEHVA